MLGELFRTFYPSLFSVAVIGVVVALYLCDFSAGVIIVAASASAIVGGALLVRHLFYERVR